MNPLRQILSDEVAELIRSSDAPLYEILMDEDTRAKGGRLVISRISRILRTSDKSVRDRLAKVREALAEAGYGA